jgi:endoglucanase
LGDFLESAKRGYFIHPGLKAVVLRVSRGKGIPVQLQASYGHSYTDAAAVSQEFAGIPSISLGIPIRYVHSPSALCHLDDMGTCLRLAEEMVRRGIEKRELSFLQED